MLSPVEIIPSARRTVRRGIELGCELFSEHGGSRRERLVDLSQEGARLSSEVPLRRGEEVVLSFVPPGAHDDRVSTLCEAIRTASRGEVYLSPEVSGFVLQGYLHGGQGEADPLSPREREILQLIAEGHTGREIAERLGLKPKTVDNHRANIMDKLGIHTTAGLVRYALQAGLAR